MTTFEMLALLNETARAGSLAAAARRLDIAPMVASRCLAALEAHLAVRLTHRTTWSIALPPAGGAFLSHAQAIIEQPERGRASVRPDDEILTGTLRVTASFPSGASC